MTAETSTAVFRYLRFMTGACQKWLFENLEETPSIYFYNLQGFCRFSHEPIQRYNMLQPIKEVPLMCGFHCTTQHCQLVSHQIRGGPTWDVQHSWARFASSIRVAGKLCGWSLSLGDQWMVTTGYMLMVVVRWSSWLVVLGCELWGIHRLLSPTNSIFRI